MKLTSPLLIKSNETKLKTGQYSEHVCTCVWHPIYHLTLAAVTQQLCAWANKACGEWFLAAVPKLCVPAYAVFLTPDLFLLILQAVSALMQLILLPASDRRNISHNIRHNINWP